MGQQRCLDSNCFGSFQPQNSNGLTYFSVGLAAEMRLLSASPSPAGVFVKHTGLQWGEGWTSRGDPGKQPG